MDLSAAPLSKRAARLYADDYVTKPRTQLGFHIVP